MKKAGEASPGAREPRSSKPRPGVPANRASDLVNEEKVGDRSGGELSGFRRSWGAAEEKSTLNKNGRTRLPPPHFPLRAKQACSLADGSAGNRSRAARIGADHTRLICEESALAGGTDRYGCRGEGVAQVGGSGGEAESIPALGAA